MSKTWLVIGVAVGICAGVYMGVTLFTTWSKIRNFNVNEEKEKNHV